MQEKQQTTFKSKDFKLFREVIDAGYNFIERVHSEPFAIQDNSA